jgi:predicted nicotinamide N-methyase
LSFDTPPDKASFIRATTQLRRVPLIPEIEIYSADEAVPLWQKTEQQLSQEGLPPPFWAFAWAGGQALARYILDHPDIVRGKTVLDLASGSGLVGIAAMKAGAAWVIAADIDPFANAAALLNARHNGVALNLAACDLLSGPTNERWDVVLAGDIFYERDTAERAFAFLIAQAQHGATILIGDPRRTYLPKNNLLNVAEYDVPVLRDIEDGDIKQTSVWRLRGDDPV